jgi:hypothetical protein
MVWPAAAVTVNELAPVAIAVQSNESPMANVPEVSITVPVSRVATTAAPVVDVTMPVRINAAVRGPVALRTPGVG